MVGTEVECTNSSYPSQHVLEKNISIILSFYTLDQKNGSRKKSLLFANHWENSFIIFISHSLFFIPWTETGHDTK